MSAKKVGKQAAPGVVGRKYRMVKQSDGMYRIIALRRVRPGVEKGDIGGWVEHAKNLSQEGSAWVSGNAWVCGNACVHGDTWVSEGERK
jgi:hypothetical protein